jgi:ABC-type nickel/cobalt efflux system permease component RcnA
VPTFINPKRAIIETGGGGGLLAAVAALVVAAVAGAAAVSFLVREAVAYRVEWAIAACAFFAVMGTAGALMLVQNRRGLQVDEAAKAEAIANARRPALPAGDVHHHVHYEDHTHHHYDERQLHIHQAPPATEQRPAIAAPKVVPGIVLRATRKAIGARQAPLYRITTREDSAIDKRA